jgi:hypothetical protein
MATTATPHALEDGLHPNSFSRVRVGREQMEAWLHTTGAAQRPRERAPKCPWCRSTGSSLRTSFGVTEARLGDRSLRRAFA